MPMDLLEQALQQYLDKEPSDDGVERVIEIPGLEKKCDNPRCFGGVIETYFKAGESIAVEIKRRWCEICRP